jgi:molybdopterin/thiamine biosynthesis adenylyltransferase
MRDYSRQPIFDQERLRQSRVTIFGTDALTHHICAYMSGLGITWLRIISDGRTNNSRNLENILKAMNEEMEVDCILSSPDPAFIGKTDILLELTNNPLTKEKCRKAFDSREDIRFFASASSSEDSGSLRIYRKKDAPLQRLLQERGVLKRYWGRNQGSYSSGIISSMLLDEIRKEVMPLEGDYPLYATDYCLCSERRLFSIIQKDKSGTLYGVKVAVVGAGGIGTYTTLNLLLMGCNVDVYDGDVVKPHNLNRQVFYFNATGENKAKVLMRRLRPISQAIRAFPFFVSHDFKEKYHSIFCCVDNWETRKLLSRMTMKTGTPLINAGVTAFNAKIESLVPGESPCLECRYDFESLMQKPASRTGCANISESNVVMTNAFAGAFMSAELKPVLFPNLYPGIHDKEARYSSKNPAKRRFTLLNIENNLQNNCICQGGLNNE